MNIRFILFTTLLIPSFLFSAPIIRGSHSRKTLKMNFGVFYDIASTNNIQDNISLSYRVGVSDKTELGLFAHFNGVLIDVRRILKENHPFTVTGSLEGGLFLNGVTSWGIELELDIELFEFLNFQIGAKGRYPASKYLDISTGERGGFNFIPFIGLEIMKKAPVSFYINSGLSFSWSAILPSFWSGAGLRYNF